MKINEFIEVVNNSKNRMLKGEQFQQFVAKTLETKEYIGIKDKRALIDDIINQCIIYEDGILKFNEIDKYIAFTMMSIAHYTNLELSFDIDDDYDKLCQAKLLNVVIETFAGEYENVKLLLAMQCDYILSSNSINAQCGKFLTNIMDKVDDFSSVLTGVLGELDLGKLPISLDDVNKLIEFVNLQKK
jgi:hypothetical protein